MEERMVPPLEERSTSLPQIRAADVGEGHGPAPGIKLQFSETGKRMWQSGCEHSPAESQVPTPCSGTPFGKKGSGNSGLPPTAGSTP